MSGDRLREAARAVLAELDIIYAATRDSGIALWVHPDTRDDLREALAADERDGGEGRVLDAVFAEMSERGWVLLPDGHGARTVTDVFVETRARLAAAQPASHAAEGERCHVCGHPRHGLTCSDCDVVESRP